MMDGYITVGMYEDGTPGEMFVTLAKEGSTVRGLMDAVGVLTSYLLQYGVPLENLAHKMRGVAFEPYGITQNLDIPFTSSPVDYVFRWMENRFVKGEQNVRRTVEVSGGTIGSNSSSGTDSGDTGSSSGGSVLDDNPPVGQLYRRDPTWERKRDEVLAKSMPLSERDNPEAKPSVLARNASTLCRECGSFLAYEEGCMKCHSCGYSDCG
jgi:ribonucleoside-diphosphate reductase alpha chain